MGNFQRWVLGAALKIFPFGIYGYPKGMLVKIIQDNFYRFCLTRLGTNFVCAILLQSFLNSCKQTLSLDDISEWSMTGTDNQDARYLPYNKISVVISAIGASYLLTKVIIYQFTTLPILGLSEGRPFLFRGKAQNCIYKSRF